jgi:hypothetical protein
MSKRGILKASKDVGISTLIQQGFDEAKLEARRPPIRSLQIKAYLRAPNRHRFGIHGISNTIQQREEEEEPTVDIQPSKKARVRLGRCYTHDYEQEADPDEDHTLKLTQRRPWLISFHNRPARERWEIAHEVNEFKRTEMQVHPGSRQNTTFMAPPSLAEVAREMEELKGAVRAGGMLEACRLIKGSPDLTVEDLVKCLDDEFKALQMQSVVTTGGKKRSGHCRRNAVLGLQDLLN